MWRLVAATLLAATLTTAGCGSSAEPAPRSAQTIGTGAACATPSARARELASVPNRVLGLPGPPFGVVAAPDGRAAFVSEAGPAEIDVVTGLDGAPRLARTVRLPVTTPPLGLTITPDGRYLLAASDGGAIVLSVNRLESGQPRAVVGTLSIPGRSTGGGGAIEVATSRDSAYAFVSLESEARIAVFDLRRSLRAGFQHSGYLGSIPTGLAPVGMAVSPDGRWLYATSELAGPRGRVAHGEEGTVTTVAIARAERDPRDSVIDTAPAGCNPVRLVVSADGSQLFVTARASDELLDISTSGLRSGSTHPRVTTVRVGDAPVGLALVDGGRRIVVADSNRFSARGGASDLSVVNVSALRAGRPSLIGRLRAGAFPREMSLTRDGQTLLVTDFAGDQIQAVGVTHLP